MAKAATKRKTADAAPASPAVHPLSSYRAGDTLANLVTGMGTSKDKGTSTTFAFNAIDRSQVEAAYRGDWMSRKVIDIPAYDATREWRTWQADSKDIGIISDLEESLSLQRKTMSVLTKARLYGGAALVMGVDQGKPEQPLIIEQLGKDCLKFVHCVSRYELTAGQIEWDITSPYFGTPQYYERSVQGATNVRLHPSRVIRFIGAEIPDITQSQGWGDSVLQIIADAVMSSGTVFQSLTTLVHEAKVDIVKIPELSERISNTDYENKLKARFAMAAVMKSIYSTLIIDKEEEWTRVNQAFAGMPEIMQEFMLLVSGAADIPATRFLGQSPKGMNSTGDSDTRNYYDRVSTEQRIQIQPVLQPLDTIMQISAFGTAPEGMFYNWNPLWQLTDSEKATIAVQQANVMTADVAAALMDPMVMQKARENQLIESGFYPGIEQIIEDYGTDIDEREPAPGANPPAMIDPQTGKPPDPNDPEAVARAQPDPNAPPAPASNVVPFKKGAPPAPPAKKKAAKAGDTAIADMAQRIRDASLDASTPRTLLIYRPVLNWREIAAFYKEQGVDNVVGSDMHVTICYSKKPVDWLKVGSDDWGNQDDQGNLTIKQGGPRVNEQFGKYVVLAFSNSDLQYRHCSILDRTDASWDYEDYTPHVSISKDPGAVNPLVLNAWTGLIKLGPEVFEEIKVDGALYEGGQLVAPPELAYTPDAELRLEELKSAVVDAVKAVPAPVVNVTVPPAPPKRVRYDFDQTGRKVIGHTEIPND